MIPDVIVAIPAHDEAELIADSLRSVSDSVRAASRGGAIRRARIAVAAHRCRDETADIARTILATSGVDHLVRVVDLPASVGIVRTGLIHDALAAPPKLDDATTWIFSTDADTVVPADWVAGTIAMADGAGADLVAGLADLIDWSASPAAEARYAHIIDAGLTADGGHTHVYAANLAVRATTFLRAGGFPDAIHGEEQGLLDAVRRGGATVLHTSASRVQTSARMPGRAEHGLGSLLARIAAAE